MKTISQARDRSVSPWTALVLCLGLLYLPATNAAQVLVCTDHGPITIDLLEQEAPAHTENFLEYVASGYYDGSVFHRVVEATLIQGGGYDTTLALRMPSAPIANESDNGISNLRGTVAAARTDDPDSASAQFYINLLDNDHLDATNRRAGYTVFGRVTEGIEVADRIGALPTGQAGPLVREVPDPLPKITSATLIEANTNGDTDTATAAEIRSQIDDASGDPNRQLELVRLFRASCATLDPALLVIEAAAALVVGQSARARYRLGDYFAVISPSHPSLPMAQALYRKLPPSEQMGIGPLIAHCRVPAVPEIPSGGDTDLDTMVEVQASVRRFMDLSDAYLECLSEVIDEEALNDIQEVAAVGRHNETVELMERLAEDFNREVREFRARQ